VTVIGLRVISLADLGPGKLSPVYLVIAVMSLSGLVNGSFGLVNVLAKWGYLVVVILATLRALRELGERAFFGLLLWAFATPILFQWISLALGVSKATEEDGSASFIGGYNHEGAFSIVLVTALAVSFLGATINLWVRAAIAVLALVGLVLANYRTTMLSAVPLIAGLITLELMRLSAPRDRGLVGAMSFVALAGGAALAVYLFADRFADLEVAIRQGGDLFKPPNQFSAADRDVFSSRFFIWSQYLDAYRRGSDVTLLIGFGPESWLGVMRLYAHNTLVSYIYEYGALGAAALVLMWLTMVVRVIMHAPGDRRWRLLCVQFAFLTINMATMGHWLIEGQILYGIACGHLFYCTEWRRRAPLPAYAEGRAPGIGVAACVRLSCGVGLRQ
jgi:hypothetical protein